MEFTDIMGELKAKMDSPEVSSLLQPGEKWLYSWDNDKIHKGADLTEVGIMPEDRFELPELSSDMHKVVEHVHAWLQARMQVWLEDKDEERLTVADCKAELQRLFDRELKAESIQKDVKSLKATYQAVIDHQGGLVEPAFR
jgi:hypothetical protein